MRTWERIGMELSVAVTTVGGLVYAYVRYFYVNPDPFAVVGHPLEPFLLHLHVIAGPVTIFFLGLVVRGHALLQIAMGNRQRRRSGWTILWTLGPAAMSGYLLQVVTSETLTMALVWVHLSPGCLFFVQMSIHIFRLWRRPAGLAGNGTHIRMPAEDAFASLPVTEPPRRQ